MNSKERAALVDRVEDVLWRRPRGAETFSIEHSRLVVRFLARQGFTWPQIESALERLGFPK